MDYLVEMQQIVLPIPLCLKMLRKLFNIGKNVDGTNNYQTEPLNATGLGVVNFTELNVTNGIKLMAMVGTSKNGVSATAANHSTTYNEFGSIHLSKNAGIGITNTTNLISASKLTVQIMQH